jgi:hypothetical protein
VQLVDDELQRHAPGVQRADEPDHLPGPGGLLLVDAHHEHVHRHRHAVRRTLPNAVLVAAWLRLELTRGRRVSAPG